MSLKHDLHLIQDYLMKGELLMGTRELSRFLKQRPQFSPKRTEIEISRRALEELQKRWKNGYISTEDHLEWINIGLLVLQKCRVLKQEVQELENREQEGHGNSFPSEFAFEQILPEHQWYETGVLRITIQGRRYFLQGLNAAIFSELAHAPLFFEQIPGHEGVKKILIEDLAIALATHDRRYTTRRALNVLQVLWSKERQSGIGRLITLLENEHWQNSTWYSDHLNHILKVYLTGLYLYLRCEALRVQLLQGANCDSKEFLRRWLYISTLHDLGYIFELSTPLKQSETLEFIQDYIRHFFAYYDRDMADELAQAGIAPNTIDKHSAQNIFSLLNVKSQKLQSMDDFLLLECYGNNHHKRIIDVLDALCQETGIGTHGVSNYYRACLVSSPPKTNGRQSFYDHGITGALLLLYVGHTLHAIFNALHKSLSIPTKRKQLVRTERLEVLEKMDEWGSKSEQFLETFEHTASILALHNIYKHLWKAGEIPPQTDLPNFWIRLDREPLAFLLMLVNTLQSWDLPGFSPLQLPEENLMSNDIDLEPDTKKILLRYPYKADTYETTINLLKSMLLPSQIDRWIAPLVQKQLPQTPPGHERKLASYNQRVINRLRGSEADPFIDSQILPVNLQMKPSEPGDQTYSIFQVAEQFTQKPVVLLGVAGIGKTTLIKHLAIRYAETGERIPVFVDMAWYSHVDDTDFSWLKTLRQCIDETSLVKLLEEGRLAVFFDGLNEVNIEQRSNAARTIANFVHSYPQNQMFITCRTAEYPNLPADVRYFEVLRVNQSKVREYLVKTLDTEQGNRLYSDLPPSIRDICRIPLMLAMLVYTYKETKNRDIRNLPVSKIAIYQEFLAQLFRREEGLHPGELPFMVREEFLIYLAQKMENKQVAVKIKKAAGWIEEFYQKRYQNLDLGIKLPTIWHEILDLPLLVSSKPGSHVDIDISFMHQTFQEYYTACGLMQDFQQNKITLTEIASHTLSGLDIWSGTLSLLVGMMDDATKLIRTIKTLAIERKDHRILRLVSDCIGEARYVDPSEVDSVTLHIIFEFKYGAVPFDYDLIESLKSIKAEKRSLDFPSRLIDDMQWWVTKYAKEQGMNLGNAISIETLLEYLESEDDILVLNALSTLRSHPNRKATTDLLVKKLQNSTGVIREQTIITLGYLEEDASSAVELLIETMRKHTENDLAKTHATAALSKIGDVRAIEAMLELVRDHTYRYRDTACWAPLCIAKHHPEEFLLIKHLQEALMEDLLREPETREGRYAKGNALYTLGELGSTEHASAIAAWMKSQGEAYVIEDGIHTLGLIGGEKELPIIRAHLKNDDFAVRMIAAQALASLQERLKQGIDVYPDLKTLLNDKTIVVREQVAEILQSLDVRRKRT
jgi:HEAT repeat protein